MVFHAGCRVKTQRFGPCKISSSTVSTVSTYILVVGVHAPLTINGPFSNGVQNKTTPGYYNSQILGRINKSPCHHMERAALCKGGRGHQIPQPVRM